MHFVKIVALALAIAVLSLATSQAQKEEAGKGDQGKKAAPTQPDPCGQPPGKWAVFAPLTDEFDEPALNLEKWSTEVGWAGRKPGLFSPTNVRVEDGKLKMFAREAHRNASWPLGFDNFTTSAIHSRSRTSQGYFEVQSRTGSSAISSSFWFHQNDGNGTWTEIDVFESVGSTAPQAKPGMNSTLMCTHTHIFMLAGVSQEDLPSKCGCTFRSSGQINGMKPCSAGRCVPMQWSFDKDFHVYGLEWNSTSIAVYADGKMVGDPFNAECFSQDIGIDFDRETMPGWMGVPDLPFEESQAFEVDYVRAWKRA